MVGVTIWDIFFYTTREYHVNAFYLYKIYGIIDILYLFINFT